eukprot:scpid68466/ scgid15665/ Pogo transposable element with KRAB domain
MSELKLHQAIVPGGCTKYVQAPDVSWKQPFKAAIRKYHEDWMLHGEKELTRGGNPRPPPMHVYLQWVVDAWASLSSAIITSSFKACGITIAADGSEDDLIHCFKSHGQIPEGLPQLKAKSAEIVTQQPEVIEEEDHVDDAEAEVVVVVPDEDESDDSSSSEEDYR